MTDPLTTLPGGQRILHRLSLALEVLDALSSQPAPAPIAVHRDDSRRQLSATGGRFVLLFSRLRLRTPYDGAQTGGTASLRITDPSRQYVPRRFSIDLWPLDQVEAVDRTPAGPYVPTLSRLLRVWISPGSAYLPGRGFSLIRGRVVRGIAPVRWPRVAARGPGGVIVGRAHGDERGEFLLPITSLGAMAPPAPSTLPVDLLVWARDPGGPPPVTDEELAIDPLADLPVDQVGRSQAPPRPADLDSPLLRGEVLPPLYVPSAQPFPIGAELGGHQFLQDPLKFAP